MMEDWRIYVFGDWGELTLIDALPEQQASFNLASFGVGTKMKISDHFNGSLDVGVPLIGQGTTKAWDPLLTFRVWAEF